MKPAYNEVVKRTFFYNGLPVKSVLSGRPGNDAPYYNYALIDRLDNTVLHFGYCKEDRVNRYTHGYRTGKHKDGKK